MTYRARAPPRSTVVLDEFPARLGNDQCHPAVSGCRFTAVSDRRLVLAGAGHAQLDLLAALAARRLEGWQVVLVTSQPDFHYSGMLPAIIAGAEPLDAASIPVAAIARAAGIDVREVAVTGLDAGNRTLALSDGASLSFDLLSLDVGSAAASIDAPGARDFAFAMRPFASAVGLLDALDAACRGRAPGESVPAAVVGGGAAGVEIALAVRARILAAGRTPAVTIVDASATDGLPLAGFGPSSRRLAATALSRRDVALCCAHAKRVTADALLVEANGRETLLPSVATAWVTGSAPQPWLAQSGLDCDARGYPLASSTLSLTADDSIFGGGDCVTLRDFPATPKAGVYAVRMAPVLARNVLAGASGDPTRVMYAPQRDFLALLNTGDGRALLRWRGVTLESQWASWLKHRIDASYLQRYRDLAR